MTEENVQDTAQESQSNVAENKPESPSNDGLLSEVMAKKAKIKEQDEIIAQYKAEKETRRTKKLEEEGKLQELLAERDSVIEKLKAKDESNSTIVATYKQNLVDGLTSDNERKEYLSTKSVDFLEELTKEKASLEPPVSNPKESLGAVRQPVKNLAKVWDMSPEDKKENWDNILESYKKNR